jgi:hypothetical protein
MTTLARLVAFVDDSPVCGTKPPGHPPHPPHIIEALVRRGVEQVALNPQPLPPGPPPELAAYLWQSVRLYQLGEIASAAKVTGNLGEALTTEATRIFDDTCGSVPISVLIQWLLHHPPPPPPPWLDVISQAVGTVLVANKLSGDLAKQLHGAAVSVIQGEIIQAKTAGRSAAAA